MQSRIGFGPYRPDLPDLVNAKGVRLAKNCIPAAGGYEAMPSLVSMALGALDGRARGAISGVTSGGSTFHFSGDEFKLYKLTTSGLTDASRAAGYGCVGDSRWAFSQFGSQVFAANPFDPMQFITADAAAASFADVPGGTAVPRATHMGVIGLQLVVGNYFDAFDGQVRDGIRWSAIGNATSWPEPGTDIAQSVLSDKQPLEGDGGWVQAVVPGSEVGAVFQESAIWRMDFRGGDVIYDINRVEPNRGLLVPELAIPFGREILYLAEDGFYRFDYTTSVPVGDNVINRTFLADLDTAHLDRVSAIQHPDKPLAVIAYPGQGNAGGVPNKVLVYQWHINQFATLSVNTEILTPIVSPTATLDDIPSGGPEVLDALTGSFDDREAAPGALNLGGYTSDHEIGSFTGPSLQAELQTGDWEHAPGKRALVTEVRPLVAGGDARIVVASTGKRNATMEEGREIDQDNDGKCPARVDGRYHRYRVVIPEGFTEAVGLDVTFQPTGAR